jgi:hypothetical protein
VCLTGVFGDGEALEAVAALQHDPVEPLDLERLDVGRGERERAGAGADEVEAAALEQGEGEVYRAGALAA